MTRQQVLAARVHRLGRLYAEIGGPTQDQWGHMLSIPSDRPVTLVNLFAFRGIADYGSVTDLAVTGREAFDSYAAVSAPALDRVGGRFVHFGSHQGNLVGDDETWDLVVVGEYPSLDALLALHEDPAYLDAYRHRVAACARQRVLISA
ncbi:DUF1330 domain-containing protein [Nocardioides dilutus]